MMPPHDNRIGHDMEKKLDISLSYTMNPEPLSSFITLRSIFQNLPENWELHRLFLKLETSNFGYLLIFQISFKGPFKIYVDKILTIFDYLPTSTWTFFTLYVDKK